MQGNKITVAFGWKLLERFGTQGVQFVLQIILARLLDPEHYGILSLMLIFTALANVFVQTGFNMSLIQNKDVTEEDYSSALWVSLAVAGVLYVAIFFAAPFIALYYQMPDIVTPLRVLALILFPGALNSIQLAKVSREMDFKKIFTSNLAAIAISGVVGIVVAYMGGGIWALVAQNVLNVLVACLVMRFKVNMPIRFVCNFKRVKTLFSFGWKILATNLLETLYADLRSLVIGKKYDSGTLGYYNRGKQFPQFIINAVNGTVKSVMLPTLSSEQDNRAALKKLMRHSMTLSAYIIFPVMMGLAAVSTSLVSLLLTDKWLPCVPYMMIYCVTLSFHPVHSCNLQAINAVGRSDIYLKLEIIKKIIGVITLMAAVAFFNSPIAIAMTGIFTTIISCFINAYPNKKLIHYSYFDQMKDLLPSFVLSLAMFVVVFAFKLLQLPAIIELIVQCVAGVAFYVGISMVLKLEPLNLVLGFLKNVLHKKIGMKQG